MNLYLVRHAHAEWSPDEGRPLSPRGTGDAFRLAKLLADRPFEVIYSSPYRRAIQTVRPLAADRKLPVQIEDRFRERALGTWTATSFEVAVLRTWQDAEFSWPGGESNQDAQARGIAALAELTADGSSDHYVVGTHGNLLALILGHFDPSVGYDFWSSLSMPDAYHLEIRGGRQARLTRLWVPVEYG
ncbi:MAG: histidine phosphatase family protein [Chloroflexota bacterium]|nr:MAG: histidine phosphatase family protein [Chloroflexota bacterium]